MNPNPAVNFTTRSIIYIVPSVTRPGGVHTIEQDLVDGRLRCDCPARKQCWAQKAIIAGLVKPRIRIALKPAPRTAPTFDLDDLGGSDGGASASAAVAAWRRAS